jgi:asparagine synthase (glutamine-hydrolysing)
MVPERFGATWYPPANPAGLTELEVASGIVLGQVPGPRVTVDRAPIRVLRDRARSLLTTPPCVVAFSGGRDSSALLAVMVDVARREGLDEPVAVTARWDDDPLSDESAWQEQVIATVGVRDWEILHPGTDLDLLGGEATTALERQGLMWPPPAYALRPMIRLASGGVFLTGEGGDEAFGLWPYGRLWSTIRSGRVPRQSDLRALILRCTPRPVRRRRWRHNRPPYQRWLRPEALDHTAGAMADDQADDPLSWVRWQLARPRATDLLISTIGQLCAFEGSQFVAPFLEPRFLAALGAWGGPLGKGDRTEVMTALFSDVLPGPVLSRTSKASFGGVFWGPASRAFAEAWDGTGLDPGLIDPDALRQAWTAPVPVYGSALPLHAAWLFDHHRRMGATADP